MIVADFTNGTVLHRVPVYGLDKEGYVTDLDFSGDTLLINRISRNEPASARLPALVVDLATERISVLRLPGLARILRAPLTVYTS